MIPDRFSGPSTKPEQCRCSTRPAVTPYRPSFRVHLGNSVRPGQPHRCVILSHLLGVQIYFVEHDLAPAKSHVLHSMVCIHDLAGVMARSVVEDDTGAHVPGRSVDDDVEHSQLWLESGKGHEPGLNLSVVSGVDSPAMGAGKSKTRSRPEQFDHRSRFSSGQGTIPMGYQHADQPSSHRPHLSNRRSITSSSWRPTNQSTTVQTRSL
jgi:hypothetical protein